MRFLVTGTAGFIGFHVAQRLLDEGHEVGVLRPTQRLLAKGVFDSAAATVAEAQMRPFGIRTVRRSDSWSQIIARARRQQVPTFAVIDDQARSPIGYVRVVDVYLAKDGWRRVIRPLATIRKGDSQLAALIQLHSLRETMLAVVDDQGQTQGLLTPDRLSGSPLGWDG